VIGVTAPSAGVDAGMRARFDFALGWLEHVGFVVSVGDCLDGSGVVSAPAQARAAELTAMLTDPEVRAVVPPWGGELAIEILPHLDFQQIAEAEPTWLVGYSDVSTILLPLTLLTGNASLHGQNLMDTPNALPAEVAHWSDAAGLGRGATLVQCSTTTHASHGAGWPNYRGDPSLTRYKLDEPGQWSLLDQPRAHLDVAGSLIGGCVEVLAPLAGSRYGDIRAFSRDYAPDGLIVYVEAAESHALDIARCLWSLRLAGWFDNANAILVGRTHAPDSGGFTQQDAVRSALAGLNVPVVLDVDCGHVVPQLVLINGATARITLDGETQALTQVLD